MSRRPLFSEEGESVVDMKRLLAVVLTAVLLGLVPAAQAEARTFKSCVELRKTFKHGVSLSRSANNRGDGPIFTPRINATVFRLNKKLDTDRDNVVCEVLMRKPKPAITPSPSASQAESPSPSPTASASNEDTNSFLLANPELCRISQSSNPNSQLRTGFPRSPDLAIRNDKIVVQLIYVDFPDLTDPAPPRNDVDYWKVGVNGFFEATTGGEINFEWRFEDRYLRMPRAISEYEITREKMGDFTRFVQDGVSLADPSVDFTDVDFVVVVMPPNVTRSQADVSPALILSPQRPFRTAEGAVFRGTLAAADTRFGDGYLLIVHEFGHLLGLEDYYFYGWTNSMPLHDQFKFMGQFDNMNYAPGDSREWTAWNRWALSFLKDDKVRCVDPKSLRDSTHVLSAASAETSRSQMVVIPTSSTSAIVIESRRNLRYDSKARTISNGLLVYRVNTKNRSGFGPIEVIRQSTSVDPLFADAPLRKGESLTVDGITISNVDSSREWDMARVVIEQ